MKKLFLVFLFLVLIAGCKKNTPTVSPANIPSSSFVLGADLSYCNELEDCGVIYSVNGKEKDPYNIFKEAGANTVRIRLWHTPNWTKYSTFDDAAISIQRAKNQQLNTLLDLHYSDTWADPAHQIIPQAWASVSSLNVLGDSLYNYTFGLLNELNRRGLLPEMIQIGNETNSEILMQKPTAENGPTNWQRNAFLFSKGLQAVEDFNRKENKNVRSMLHVAQPENALSWFANAKQNNLTTYDLIGLSYYPNWSSYNLQQLGETIRQLKTLYKKDVIVVETGYPFTMKNFDQANNVLGDKSALYGYPISPEGQLKFMLDLTSIIKSSGGNGVIYWEPAWVSSPCKTLWGTGSHWENAAFFDSGNANNALPVLDFFKK